MFKKEGYWDVVPQIKNVSFPIRGKWQVDLVVYCHANLCFSMLTSCFCKRT